MAALWLAAAAQWSPSAALAREHRRDGPGDDLEVEPERPAVDVLEILLDPVIELGMAAGSDLPEARHPRLHLVSPAMPDFVLDHLARERGSRSNQAHLPTQHVPQLRKFVERRPAKEPPDTGHARVTLHLEGMAADHVVPSQIVEPLLSVRAHAAELDHFERPPVQPHTLLPEECATGRVELHEPSKQREEGRRGSRRPKQVGADQSRSCRRVRARARQLRSHSVSVRSAISAPTESMPTSTGEG